jgi:hypothetical protein
MKPGVIMSENGDLQHDRDDQTSRREEEDFDQRDQRDERQYDEDEISRDQQPKEESHGNAEDTKFSIHITGDEIGFKVCSDQQISSSAVHSQLIFNP